MAESAEKVKDIQPLRIIVVGAGIGGLSAAVALRQAGHNVEIFEKSKFATEIGAALSLSSNGVRVLRSLGFDFERARARQMMVWESVHGDSLERISALDFSDAKEKYGDLFMAVHRIDLHKELLRLALDEEGEGLAGTLRLGSPVVEVSPEQGWVKIQDGTVHTADLIVAADGLHSVIRGAALQKEATPTHSGLSAFRFLADTETLRQDESIRKLLEEWKAPGATILADTSDKINERHMVWYDCQGGEVQNFVGIHPTRDPSKVFPETQKDGMIQEFGHFHPEILKILRHVLSDSELPVKPMLIMDIRISQEVKCWPLYIHDPLPRWTYGNVVLIGDAAHPMLPFGGQGSNQAIEDGGALGFLLKGIGDTSEIPHRLEKFEEVRRKRAARVQLLSKTRVGREKDVEEQLKEFAETEDKRVPNCFPERIAHDFGFDVLGKCKQVLASG